MASFKDDIFSLADTHLDFNREYKKFEIEEISPSSSQKEIDLQEKLTKDKKISRSWLVLLVLFLVFLGRGAYLQIRLGDVYAAAQEAGRFKQQVIPAPRGKIFDRNGTVLADNIPAFAIAITPSEFFEHQNPDTASRIALTLGEEKQTIAEELSSLPRFFPKPIPFRDGLDFHTAVLGEVLSDEIPGLSLEVKTARRYAAPSESLGHILGYLGKISPEELQKFDGRLYTISDWIGKAGIESFFESTLRGQPEVVVLEVDSKGQQVRKLLSDPKEKGQDLTLTVDLELQRRLEEVMERNLQARGLEKGAGVLLDPSNGEILALVSLPGLASGEYFVRAIAGQYLPGSVIKPLLALAALEDGIVEARQRFLSTGGLKVGSSFFPDWKAGGHGLVDLTEALAWSVNTYFYIIGGGYEAQAGLTLDRIAYYFERFHLGRRLGVELPGEAEGFFPSPDAIKGSGERWYTGDTYNLSIGQGRLGVTPLQVAFVTSVFANGGTLYKPKILRGGDPIVLEKNLGKSQNIEAVRRGLKAAVDYGSAQKLQALPVSAAGKTGTSQWQTNKDPHSWFTGFAPYRNPEVVISVLVEEGGEGSGIALDIAKEFLEWYFTR